MVAAAGPRPRSDGQVLPAGVRGADGAPTARVRALLLAAAAVRAAATLRVPRSAASLVGVARVRTATAAHAGPLRPSQAGALPEPGRRSRARPPRAARRVQPLYQQGPRDTLAGVPADRATSPAGGGEAAQVPQPAEQDAGPRATLRVSRGRLRPPLLALRRAHAAHPYPHRSEAVPVPHLHALLQPLRPPDDARTHAYR